jgi:hypothetical protein
LVPSAGEVRLCLRVLPLRRSWLCVSAIGEDALQDYGYPPHRLEQRDKAVAVLDVGRRDGHTDQAQRVDNGVALLALTGCK